jgi:hypothetical protein
MGVQWGSISATNRFQESLDSVRREVLCNILTEFGVHMKPIHSLMELRPS